MGLEQLRRYIARQTLSDERVQRNAAGQWELKLNTPWRDGTTHLAMSPLEFMQRMAVLVPRRLLHPVITASRLAISGVGCPVWVVNSRQPVVGEHRLHGLDLTVDQGRWLVAFTGHWQGPGSREQNGSSRTSSPIARSPRRGARPLRRPLPRQLRDRALHELALAVAEPFVARPQPQRHRSGRRDSVAVLMGRSSAGCKRRASPPLRVGSRPTRRARPRHRAPTETSSAPGRRTRPR